jgi:hypothetical protein
MWACCLSVRELSLDMEIQADECKGQRDRLGVLIRRRRKGVDDVLMNELRMSVCEGVRAQFVVSFLLARYGAAVRTGIFIGSTELNANPG